MYYFTVKSKRKKLKRKEKYMFTLQSNNLISFFFILVNYRSHFLRLKEFLLTQVVKFKKRMLKNSLIHNKPYRIIMSSWINKNLIYIYVNNLDWLYLIQLYIIDLALF